MRECIARAPDVVRGGYYAENELITKIDNKIKNQLILNY